MKIKDLDEHTVYAVRHVGGLDRGVVLFPALWRERRSWEGGRRIILGYTPEADNRSIGGALGRAGIPILQCRLGVRPDEPITDASLLEQAAKARMTLRNGGAPVSAWSHVKLVQARLIETTWAEHLDRETARRDRRHAAEAAREAEHDQQVAARTRIYAVLGDRYPHQAVTPSRWTDLEAMLGAYARASDDVHRGETVG